MKPSFCYIAPTSYLQYTTVSKTHLVLAHLVDRDETYANFYHTLSEQDPDVFIMMDNSAYELKEPYSPSTLLTLARKCGAHAVVLPDYPFQESAVTIRAAEQFIPIFKDAGLKTFFVPQSKRGELSDWVAGYEWAAGNDDIDIIGMSILGIPNAMPHVEPAFARVVATELLIDAGVFNFNKHHHYLGLNSGPALEIPSLLRSKALTTVDSSGPIWTAILGHEYTINADSYLAVRKPTQPVDFDIALSKDAHTQLRVLHNINMTQQLFTDTTTPRVWYAEE